MAACEVPEHRDLTENLTPTAGKSNSVQYKVMLIFCEKLFLGSSYLKSFTHKEVRKIKGVS